MYETLQIINLIIIIAAGAIALLATICRPFRNKILGIKQKKNAQEEEYEDSKETDRCMLRHTIRNIYNEYKDKRCIDEMAFEDLEHLVKQYKKLNGNTFVDKIWKEVQDWEIK